MYVCFLSQHSPQGAAPQWLLLILADEAGLSKSPANPISPYTEPQVTPSHKGSAGWQCLHLHLPHSLWNPDSHLCLLFAPWGIRKELCGHMCKA